jgi:hypothetical protein
MLSASRLGVRAHTAVACILGADVLRELEAAASAHDRDLTLLAPATAPAPAPVTELEAAASAQPSTSQSPSADELDGAPVPPARVAPRRTRGYTQQANERAKADKGGNKANPIIFGDSDDESSARTSKADDFCVDVESQEWKPLPQPSRHRPMTKSHASSASARRRHSVRSTHVGLRKTSVMSRSV